LEYREEHRLALRLPAKAAHRELAQARKKPHGMTHCGFSPLFHSGFQPDRWNPSGEKRIIPVRQHVNFLQNSMVGY
jgi:hypothetical protein